MRARAPLVDHRRCDTATLLGLGEKCADLRGGVERHDIDICYPRRPRLGIVLDLMFLFVKVVFTEEIVDRFVVLRERISMLACRMTVSSERRGTHDFEELAFHLVFPAFRFHLVGDTENLVNCAWNHSCGFFGLNDLSVK
jgi:hypothetical protein